ncbi:hypothetical protein BDC45DRAFT_535168 [Circinella umbellata]|nr:hypothetical protein BDC45DRAFT_535168 [Circinella umbellata]
MQQLRTLHCEYIDYNRESLVTLLNTCCNTIQDVKLQHSTKVDILDVATLQSLETLPELRMLTIKPARFVNTSSMLALLKRVPALENLILIEEKIVTLSEEAVSFLRNLRHLALEKTYI